MKSRNLSLAFLFVAGLAVGCASTGEQTAADPKHLGTVAVEREKLKTETKEAGRAMQSYASAEKRRFDQWAQSKQKRDRAENATESSWNDMKSGFIDSYGRLKEMLNQARQWVSEKIAP